MELEFDKEIDAILRKARPNKGVLVGDDPPEPKEPRDKKPHVDADAIAAFVEDAVPEKTRRVYIEHFADCDHCRRQLAFAMQMMPEAGAETVAESAVAGPEIEKPDLSYQSIFRSPQIAVAMGALVLAFTGILGYLVLNQQQTQTDATVAIQTQKIEQRHGGPYDAESAETIPTPSEVPTVSLNANAAAASNVAANTAIAGQNEAPNSSVKPAAEMAPANAAPEARSGQFQVDGASGSENNFVLDAQDAAKTQPPAKKSAALAAAPPPATTDSVAGGVAANERDEKKAVKEEADKDARSLMKRKGDDRALRRDFPAAAAKSGPAQNNQSNQSNVYQMTVSRSVGGKTFSNRDGAWYDSAYKNQPTTNYRRGTAEYKKLDSGLRSIADTLGGTVVVVWKSKAYRIQ